MSPGIMKKYHDSVCPWPTNLPVPLPSNPAEMGKNSGGARLFKSSKVMKQALSGILRAFALTMPDFSRAYGMIDAPNTIAALPRDSPIRAHVALIVSACILMDGISQNESERSQLRTKHLVGNLSIVQEVDDVSEKKKEREILDPKTVAKEVIEVKKIQEKAKTIAGKSSKPNPPASGAGKPRGGRPSPKKFRNNNTRYVDSYVPSNAAGRNRDNTEDSDRERPSSGFQTRRGRGRGK